MYRLLFFDDSFLEFPLNIIKVDTYSWDGKNQPKYLILEIKHKYYKEVNELLEMKTKFLDKKLRSIFLFDEDGQHLEFAIPIDAGIQDIYFEEGNLIVCYGDPTYMGW